VLAGIALFGPTDVQVGFRKSTDPAKVTRSATRGRAYSPPDHRGRHASCLLPLCRPGDFDFRFGEVLRGSACPCWEAPGSNCSFYGSRRDHFEVRVFAIQFSPYIASYCSYNGHF